MIHAPYTSAMRSIQQKHLYLTLVALLWTSSLPATGQYECRLKSENGKKVFRERSNQSFTVQEQPLIRLTPLSRQIHCEVIREVKLECSVNEPYTVELYLVLSTQNFEVLGTGNSSSYSFLIPICEKTKHTFTCQVFGRKESKRTTLEITTGDPVCEDDVFGTGNLGQMAVGSCERDEVGERKGVCQEDGSWREVENNCILGPVQELLLQSEFLDANSLPGFLDTLSDVTVNFTEEVVKSPTNINAIVDILSNVANTSLPINSDLAEDILLTACVLTTYGAWKTWESLNNDTRNASQMRRIYTFLQSLETITGQYECRLKSGQKIFRERSNRNFTLQEQPLIQLTPLSRQIHCEVIREVKIECSVNEPYTVELRNSTGVLGTGKSNISYNITINCDDMEHTFTCQVFGRKELKRTTLEITTGDPVCEDDVFGTGNLGQMAVGSCERDEVGERKGVCQEDGSWREVENNCILGPVQELLLQSDLLDANSLPGFLDTLSDVTVSFTEEVVKSPTNINAIVDILSNVANTSLPINSDLAEDILLTAGVLTTDGARETWESLNNDTRNASQTKRSFTFLQSLETITGLINDVSLAIDTPSILLNKTTFTDSFNASFNSSVTIVISEPGEGEKNITVMTFASMDNVLPARDEANSSRFDINGRVVLVQTSIGNSPINISFTFNLNNPSLVDPQCVFWNFSLFDDRGGWDNEGCMLVEIKNGSVTCNCNHLTSFSILMSPFVNCEVCSLITFIGVGISMASLVICLIIEAVIWRKIRRNTTSYLRHVSIVNIAVSLLIADIWFIIGASISKASGDNRDACSAATFFIHFFYLAMFFWMLALALLLLYRTVSVIVGGLSKRSMLAIGFSVGYGGPIIIAVITIAATAPSERYKQGKFCWLNFTGSFTIIAFVLPALTIVLFNLIVLIVVLFKMLRRRAVTDSAQAGQRNVLLLIARTLAVLTPLFGLTWGLGIGTLADPENQGIHIAFSFFNSLQGFFILVFGLLLDKKVRSEIAIKSQISGSGTSSTSAGNSSSAFGFLRLWRQGRDGNNISSNDSNVTQSLNPS
ncbi:adhesion G-protein coupled receptor F1 isoform X2 [Labrus bergylta]|uniref:adhesion G-protein coupled receptor F1 isoform X2 n=1 Tax=Labrus bergylta TaxID=56723 RepID=UPI003313F166